MAMTIGENWNNTLDSFFLGAGGSDLRVGQPDAT
jgi:hypothetical protein